jgi:5-keto 4-deoxyuronate isomerase
MPIGSAITLPTYDNQSDYFLERRGVINVGGDGEVIR